MLKNGILNYINGCIGQFTHIINDMLTLFGYTFSIYLTGYDLR